MKKEVFTMEARSHGGAVLLNCGPTRGTLFRFGFPSTFRAQLTRQERQGSQERQEDHFIFFFLAFLVPLAFLAQKISAPRIGAHSSTTWPPCLRASVVNSSE